MQRSIVKKGGQNDASNNEMAFDRVSGFGSERTSPERCSWSIGGANKTAGNRRRTFLPYYPWGCYPYAYPRYYVPANYGEVKIETHRKDLVVYIDGGYAAEIRKDKKFTLRPGNHEIELRDRDGQTVYRENVAVIIGKTTKLQVS